MKKLSLFLFFFTTFTLFAQQKVAKTIQQLTDAGKPFETIAPLSVIAPQDKKEAVVRNATFAQINQQVLETIVTNAPETFMLSVPYDNKSIQVKLYKVDVFAPGFHIDTDKQKGAAFTKGVHYRGIINGDRNSLAAFNFFKSEMNGIVSSKETGNLVVAKQLHEDSDSYIIYSDANLAIPNNFACHTKDPEDVATFRRSPQGEQNVQSQRCVTMYFEIDNNLYVQNNSSIQQTGIWMTSVYNNVQTLFNNDGISTALKSVYIWTTPDPYSGSSSGDYLSQFGTNRPIFDGDLGQLVGIDPGGLGGVAVTIAGICSNSNFSYSDVDFQYSNVPTFSWTVQVITHELGHLMGSPHTHGCYWGPNNNTAIDGCGSSQGYVEGNCNQGPIPSAQGTIMSYCHLVNTGISFANGFGPQPAQRIINHVDSSLCLSTDCINTCINMVKDFTVSVTTTTAVVNWTTENGSTGPWQVSVVPVGSDYSNWQTTASNSYNATGLTANTYYKIGIRPVCADGQVPAIKALTFGTYAVNACAGFVFTDSGGLTAQYPNNEYLIRTYVPTTAGTAMRAVFQIFNTEANSDLLYVYNGTSPLTENIIGVYSGSSSPGTITSTSPDGALTFKFTSDPFRTFSGWRAAITCVTALGTNEATFTDFSYYPNPSSGLVNIKAAEAITSVQVYNVAGQLLKLQNTDSTEATIDISSFADGVYFFRVANDSRQANFRIVKQ